MINYRKVGGIHWVAIGPYRFSFCKVVRPKRTLPKAIPLSSFLKEAELKAEWELERRLTTYAEQEHNRFIF